MASSSYSMKQTLLTAFFLCVVCSVLVSIAAVALKPMQDANRIQDRNRNILVAAGVYDAENQAAADIGVLFDQFTPRIVDLVEGRFLNAQEINQLGIDIATYDQRRATSDPRYSRPLTDTEDIAKIKRLVRYPLVYVAEQQDQIQKLVLPVSGYGLWSIIYGYLVLEGDANTVIGIGFYESKETPGLGAEVTSPSWLAQWSGKKVFTDNGSVALRVIRGSGAGESEISGIAGATLTSRGVDNLIQFWMGGNGFGPLLRNLGGN